MLAKIALLCTVAATCAAAPAAYASAPQPTTFDFTGTEQSYVVPAGVTAVRVTAVGAPGGAGYFGPYTPPVTPGQGAQVTGDLAVTPGELLFVEVGGPGGSGDASNGGLPGFNGGGAGGSANGGPGGYGGGGGGASDVRLCSVNATGCDAAPSSLASRLLVAGGGGGSGGDVQVEGGYGGLGGDAGKVGSPGGAPSGGGGGGGTQLAGGVGGAGGMCAVSTAYGLSGSDGVFGAGGIGGIGVYSGDTTWGGGGGGGYYGGGGGGDGCEAGGGGGGGGSSYGPAGATFATAVPGDETPYVTITPFTASVQVTPATLSFASQSPSTLSLPQTVTITNTGNGPLTIAGLTFAGPSANDFLVGSSSCGGSIAPAESCQLTIRFAPSASGLRTASLTITSNDPASPTSVQLSGIGAQPAPSGSATATGSATTTAPGAGTGGQLATPVTTPPATPGATPKTLGTVKLLSCRTSTIRAHSGSRTATRHVSRCTSRALSANAKFIVTAVSTRATLARHGKVYARGVSNHRLLVLRANRPLPVGTYVLTLDYGDHRTTTNVVVR